MYKVHLYSTNQGGQILLFLVKNHKKSILKAAFVVSNADISFEHSKDITSAIFYSLGGQR